MTCDTKVEVEGGAPHGFGVWIDGKYHPVNLGALGTVITNLQAEVEALKQTNKSLVKLEAVRAALHSIVAEAEFTCLYIPFASRQTLTDTLGTMTALAKDALEKSK